MVSFRFDLKFAKSHSRKILRCNWKVKTFIKKCVKSLEIDCFSAVETGFLLTCSKIREKSSLNMINTANKVKDV